MQCADKRNWVAGILRGAVATTLLIVTIVVLTSTHAFADRRNTHVQPHPVFEGPATTSQGPIVSNCPPNYCGTAGEVVSLRWYYPHCGADELNCGTENWFCRFLTSDEGTCKVNPTQTTGTGRTTISVTIATKAKPGKYLFEVGATCSNTKVTCNPADIYLIVKPKIEGDKEVWFFNFESVKGYKTDLKLTAKNDNLPPSQYTWAITDGSDYAEIVNENTNPIFLFSRDFPPQNKGDVTLTVTANGVTSDPFTVRVKRPYRIVPIAPPDDHGLIAHGYQSLLHYEIRDQFDEVLPHPVPAREVFTGGQINDMKNDWIVGKLNGYGGAYSNPSDFKDDITGQFSILGFVPVPEPKAPPACKGALCPNKVFHFCGYIVVGGTCELCGVMVATLAWQRYTDHGRHCNRVSPSASPRPNQSLPACPGPNATSC